MTENKIGQIPDFTVESSETTERVQEEVKETISDDVVEETETPAELPAESEESEQKPVQSELDVDTGNLTKQVHGLQDEREKLRHEIETLRGTRRELRQQEISKVDQKIIQVSDELQDLHPEDISLIEKVARA